MIVSNSSKLVAISKKNLLASSYSQFMDLFCQVLCLISFENFHSLGHSVWRLFCLFSSFKHSNLLSWTSQVAQWVKNPPANTGDVGLVPRWGRYPGGGNGNPLQHSYLGNPMDREAWQATVHGGPERVRLRLYDMT